MTTWQEGDYVTLARPFRLYEIYEGVLPVGVSGTVLKWEKTDSDDTALVRWDAVESTTLWVDTSCLEIKDDAPDLTDRQAVEAWLAS